MSFFVTTSAADRYDRFRPKVHHVILDWLYAAVGRQRFSRALDIACGTGDSTKPLLQVADSVEGIDASPEMIELARANGVNVRLGTYDNLPSKQYDLLTVCMAFHWFDRNRAVQSFMSASTDSAVWLIYNFGFARHPTDRSFNDWMRTWYQSRFPSPARAAYEFRVTADDTNLVEVAYAKGVLSVHFDRQSLIGFLTTQSNIEEHVRNGSPYADVERQLDESMPIPTSEQFNYGFTYTIVKVTSPS